MLPQERVELVFTDRGCSGHEFASGIMLLAGGRLHRPAVSVAGAKVIPLPCLPLFRIGLRIFDRPWYRRADRARKPACSRGSENKDIRGTLTVASMQGSGKSGGHCRYMERSIFHDTLPIASFICDAVLLCTA
jgi:hypothetical protein